MGFSKDFVWGAATSSYQIEGGVSGTGKGMHIWDVYTKEPGRVYGGHTGDTGLVTGASRRYRKSQRRGDTVLQ